MQRNTTLNRTKKTVSYRLSVTLIPTAFLTIDGATQTQTQHPPTPQFENFLPAPPGQSLYSPVKLAYNCVPINMYVN